MVVASLPKRYKQAGTVSVVMTITHDEDVLGGEPRIDGTRIGVRHVAAWVIEAGRSPAAVADQFDITLAAIYEALSYYYEHVEEMREYEQANEAAFEEVRKSSLKPKETVE
jgi:uncharacterized protein (DUF433 family)